MSDEKVIYVSLIPVVDIDTGEVKEINRESILIIGSDRRGLVFQTEDGRKYRQPRNQEEIEEAWFHRGFRSTDSTNVCNFVKAQVYDEWRGRLYFDPKPNELSLYGDVAAAHTQAVMEISIARGLRVIPANTKSKYHKIKEQLTRVGSGSVLKGN
ncbi:hypothetical protein SAMN02799630_02829 [Paenibacillus sp. UNCCL117]|uniref:hypothetical protein n=1 Tax=unclassified Paenibacillus TaxID=185978 RepID=UPI00088765AE|nr:MULTISPECIES: hypothetical protein [unclassified Paenibacillus]SDD28837.1 hypothetical protein SAMN04488602_107162 [Paenibacillus sp. cl123]SFW40855.1 hypothetical protein SAMN02799630_02829 [Paenibacillus sp. UNCCL117]